MPFIVLCPLLLLLLLFLLGVLVRCWDCDVVGIVSGCCFDSVFGAVLEWYWDVIGMLLGCVGCRGDAIGMSVFIIYVVYDMYEISSVHEYYNMSILIV